MKSLNQKLEILKVVAHPIRIRILEELKKEVKCVSDFEDFLKISQPNVSQHLTLLRNHKIVDYYINGRLRCYYLVEPMILDILDTLNKEYSKDLTPPDCCSTKENVVK